ncbi:hypothetical protein B296_00015504 [Ensete ventricosum]|uniref:Uncharacterized protein n=1 Tax=Ensete ventricosum TaxID=4639 RepID=A0A427B551_ENSVE|nr:hypothetical protein B296_00015504 [Ensete ventricosum]
MQVIERGEEAMTSPDELSYPKAKRQSEGGRLGGVPQCYKGRFTDHLGLVQGNGTVMDSMAMGLVAPWYRRGRTSVEPSIPCSYRGRALVVKGAEEIENAEENSKYQDKVEGQRPRNFIRPVSMSFSSR